MVVPLPIEGDETLGPLGDIDAETRHGFGVCCGDGAPLQAAGLPAELAQEDQPTVAHLTADEQLEPHVSEYIFTWGQKQVRCVTTAPWAWFESGE